LGETCNVAQEADHGFLTDTIRGGIARVGRDGGSGNEFSVLAPSEVGIDITPALGDAQNPPQPQGYQNKNNNETKTHEDTHVFFFTLGKKKGNFIFPYS
jgi:hypothetical protein